MILPHPNKATGYISGGTIGTLMNSEEKRICISLAAVYALRMLGLFMVLPVLSLYAGDYTGNTDMLKGFALGAYGLTQAFLQIPFGYLSDRFGRKSIILAGLFLFLVGSVLAGLANDIYTLIAGRCLQGSGAIASVMMALLSDMTRPEHRSKAMASVGASIGLSFALALVLGPLIADQWGLSGMFFITAVFAGLAMALLVVVVPAQKTIVSQSHLPTFGQALKVGFGDPQLRILNCSVFILHLMLTAAFLVIPALLLEHWQLPINKHWIVYLIVLFAALVIMLPAMLFAEKRGKLKEVMLLAAASLLISQVLLALLGEGKVAGFIAVLIFFAGFNLFEAILPSELSKKVDPAMRGAAMGAFSTSQFLGAFVGGSAGGVLLATWGPQSVYWLCAGLVIPWLFILRSYVPAVKSHNL